MTNISKSYFPNGQLESKGAVKDGLQVGSWTFYYENGQIHSQGEFNTLGQPTGIWTEYYESGNLKYETISPRGNWFSIDDSNLEIINYWDDNVERLIVNGHGILSVFYPNGQLQHRSHWQERLKNGPFEEYHDNGNLKRSKIYRNSKPEGTSIIYFPNGNPKTEMNYLNGRLEGRFREWYENRQLMEEGQFFDEEFHVRHFWTEDGNQIMIDGTGKAIRKFGADKGNVYEETFEDGKLITRLKLSGIRYGKLIPKRI